MTRTFTETSLRWLVGGTLVTFLCGGCLQEGHLQRGRKALAQGNSAAAAAEFHKVLLREEELSTALEAARVGAPTAALQLKNYHLAIFFYRYLVGKSSQVEERRSAQEQIANIYFAHLFDYAQALHEYHALLQWTTNPAQLRQHRLRIAKSYYYLNNFYQAKTEMAALLRESLGVEEEQDLMVLYGNILLTMREVDEALKTFEAFLKKFSHAKERMNVQLSLAIGYEEKKEYKKAITLLESVKAQHEAPEYIQARIQSLAAHLQSQPGKNGLKK